MSNGTSTTTIREYNAISPELKDYFVGFGTPGTEGFSPGLLGKAQEVYARPYEQMYAPYLASNLVGGNRVAPLRGTEAGQQFYNQLMSMSRPESFTQAGQFTGQAAAGLQGLAGLQAQNVYAPNLQTFQMAPTPTVSAGPLQTFQMAGPQTFGAAQAEQYMSPYAQAVTDVAKRKAMEDAQRSQLQANLGAGRRGSLGSSGQILATTERERQLGQQLGDIQARGLQEAYTSAQTQFERDRAAQMLAGQRNLEAQLGVQQLGSQQGLEAQRLNQAALQESARQNLLAALGVQQLGSGQSLEAQRANQQAQLQAAQQRVSALSGLGALGAQAGQLGTLQQAADIDRLKVLGAYSDTERGLEQQRRDLEYQDLMRRVQFPEQQLFGMSSLLRGTPMGERIGTTSATTPPPSFLSQLTGAGLTGLSLYNLGQPRRD